MPDLLLLNWPLTNVTNMSDLAVDGLGLDILGWYRDFTAAQQKETATNELLDGCAPGEGFNYLYSGNPHEELSRITGRLVSAVGG